MLLDILSLFSPVMFIVLGLDLITVRVVKQRVFVTEKGAIIAGGRVSVKTPNWSFCA